MPDTSLTPFPHPLPESASPPPKAPKGYPTTCVTSDVSTPSRRAGGPTPVLPVDCVAEILSRCHPRDICRLSTVSPTWAQAGASEQAWCAILPRMCRESLSQHLQGVTATSSPRQVYGIIRKGVYSRDGAHFLTVAADSGKLCVHVSLSHSLGGRRPSAADAQVLMRKVGGIQGSVFDPCSVVVTARSMQMECRISPAFILPGGEFKLGLRLGTVACQPGVSPTHRFRMRDSAPAPPLSVSVTQGMESESKLIELEKVKGEECEVVTAADDILTEGSQNRCWRVVPGCPFHDPEASSPGAPRGAVPAQHRSTDRRPLVNSSNSSDATVLGAGFGTVNAAVPAGSSGDISSFGQGATVLEQLLTSAAADRASALWSQAGRQVARLMSVGKCTCHQATQIQAQRREILRRISDLEQMMWESIPLGVAAVAPSQADTSAPGGSCLGAGTLEATVQIGQGAEERGQCRMHIDSFVLTHL